MKGDSLALSGTPETGLQLPGTSVATFSYIPPVTTYIFIAFNSIK
jgi:hypothetical protein